MAVSSVSAIGEKVTDELPGLDGSMGTLDGYLRLLAGVLLQAMIDTESDDLPTRVESILWLASDEAQFYGELLEVGDVWRFYVNGNRIPASVKRRGASVNGWRVK